MATVRVEPGSIAWAVPGTSVKVWGRPSRATDQPLPFLGAEDVGRGLGVVGEGGGEGHGTLAARRELGGGCGARARSTWVQTGTRFSSSRMIRAPASRPWRLLSVRFQIATRSTGPACLEVDLPPGVVGDGGVGGRLRRDVIAVGVAVDRQAGRAVEVGARLPGLPLRGRCSRRLGRPGPRRARASSPCRAARPGRTGRAASSRPAGRPSPGPWSRPSRPAGSSVVGQGFQPERRRAGASRAGPA